MVDYREALDAQQLKAATHEDESLLVLAGPGSGKTRVLVYRAVYLLNEFGVSPERLILCTFTRKAAAEMAIRIAELLPEDVVRKMHIRTIHSLCLWILRREGFKQDVISEYQQKKLMQHILGYKGVNWDIGWRYPLSMISAAKASGIHVTDAYEFFQDYMEDAGIEPVWMIRDFARRLSDCYSAYESFKRDGCPGAKVPSRLLDFDDMLLWVQDMLFDRDNPIVVTPLIRDRYQEMFSHILLDEAQDTSRQAMEILECLANPQQKMFVVGDVDQELFGFNFADPEYNVFGFQERLDCEIVKLGVNYRSTHKIVANSARLIDKNYDEDTKAFQKVLVPAPWAEEGDDIEVVVHDDVHWEALWAVDTIVALIEEGFSPGDFFIIYRVNALSEPFEGLLLRRQVPYCIEGALGFYARKVVKDVVAYMRLVVDRHNDEAFSRVANIASMNFKMHFRGLGQAFFRDCHATGQDSLWDGMLVIQSYQTSFKRRGIDDLIETVCILQRGVDEGAPPTVLIQHIRDLVYDSYLTRSEGLDDSNAVLSTVGGFEELDMMWEAAERFGHVESMLEYVDEIESVSKDPVAQEDSVVLTSIHRVKGRERPVVIVVGVSDGILPHARALGYRGSNELPLVNLSGLQDERCAMYVAVTRPKSRLYLSSVLTYRGREVSPSRFLAEMGLGETEKSKGG